MTKEEFAAKIGVSVEVLTMLYDETDLLWETDAPALDPDASLDGTSGVKRHPLKGRRLSELKHLKDPVWILQDMIPAGFIVGYSKPKRGKSFYFIELSLCMAAGAPFHGVELGKSGPVLYIAAEGGAVQVRNRALRIIEKRGLDMTKVEQNWLLVDQPFDLNDKKSLDTLLEQNPGPWAMVVIDTLARNMSGDENTTADMNEVVHACDYIRRKAEALGLILIHHEGWANTRPRGAIALFAALDCLMHFERDEKTLGLTKVTVEELRDAAIPERSSYFTLTGGTLDPVDGPAVGVAKLQEREAAIRDVLVKLCDDAPGGIPVTQWKGACETQGIITGSYKVKWQAWKRALEYLADAKCIAITGKIAVPVEPSAADDFPS